MHNSEAIFREHIVDFSTAFFVVSLGKTKYIFLRHMKRHKVPYVMKLLIYKVQTKWRQIKNMLQSKKHNIIML